MSSEFLTCIPDFAQNLPPLLQPFATILKCCQPTGDQLYSILYALGQSFQLVTSGTFGPIESELESTFTRFAIVITAPWVLIFIAVFVLLMAQRTISVPAGVFFIVLSIILAVLAVIWTLHDVSVTTTALSNAFRNTITGNINKYQGEIIAHVIGAYILTASCNPNEPDACCGFNRSFCFAGCTKPFQIDTPAIPSASTGKVEVTISSNLDLSGTITVPPEIVGGKEPRIIPFAGVNSFTIPYNTTATPGVYNVNFISRIGPTGAFNSTTLPVVVYDKKDAPPPALTNIEGLGGIDMSKLTEEQIAFIKKVNPSCAACR